MIKEELASATNRHELYDRLRHEDLERGHTDTQQTNKSLGVRNPHRSGDRNSMNTRECVRDTFHMSITHIPCN